eukprot:4945830-Alexandrium_andersonii.AAC.1
MLLRGPGRAKHCRRVPNVDARKRWRRASPMRCENWSREAELQIGGAGQSESPVARGGRAATARW